MKMKVWGKIRPKMCDRCKKTATNFFNVYCFLSSYERAYCDEHLLEKLKEENIK